MLNAVTIQRTGTVPRCDALCTEPQLTFHVFSHDISVETDQILITGAAMCIVAGEMGDSPLVTATIADNMQ